MANHAEKIETAVLGKTGITSGRLGIAGGFGAPARAVEMAFEYGCNYFYHGSLRRAGMTQAIKNICRKGKRDELVITAQVYTRWGWQFRRSFEKFLAKTGLDYADILLLGWYNGMPPGRILDMCSDLREKGMVRHIAVSGHNRENFPRLAREGVGDVYHIRYNAVHRGAEEETFPMLPGGEERPGVVIYTATSWRQLINPKKTPPGEKTPRASDCYRFVLANPSVDVCIAGPASYEQMKETLEGVCKGPMPDDELQWMRRVGDYIKG